MTLNGQEGYVPHIPRNAIGRVSHKTMDFTIVSRADRVARRWNTGHMILMKLMKALGAGRGLMLVLGTTLKKYFMNDPTIVPVG